MSKDLNPKNARIFRIVHRDNLPWIFDHGLHCRSSTTFDPNYINIGNPELIDKRSRRGVPITPYGTLSDYVPLYFTPWSPMLYNINTGHNGVVQRPNEEIVFLASSLHRLLDLQVEFVFTDRHAYLKGAEFAADLVRLDMIDWNILQQRDFERDREDLGKFERYQAEALVHRLLPLNALLGIACFNMATKERIDEALAARGRELKVLVKPRWYF